MIQQKIQHHATPPKIVRIKRLNKDWVPIVSKNDRFLLPFAKLLAPLAILGSTDGPIAIITRAPASRSWRQLDLMGNRAAPVVIYYSSGLFQGLQF
jgi:hypothetical protein